MLDSKVFTRLLSDKGYDYDIHEHEALFTVDDSNKLRGKIKGSHSREIKNILGYSSREEIIHKDDLVKI